MNQDANRFLMEEPIGKLMVKFAVPSIISMLIAALYNMVDQIYIGHGIGYLGNSATSVVYPLTVIALAIALLFGSGCGAYFSISQGRKEYEKSCKAVGNASLMTLLCSLVLVAMYGIFQQQFLGLFGATEHNVAYATEYFRYLMIGIPFYMLSNMLNIIIRADGSPRLAMGINCIGCILNIILDPVAIFVLEWGMMGAAVATVFGQMVSGILSVAYLFHTKSFHLKKSSFMLDWKILKNVMALGISSFFTQVTIVIVTAVLNNALVKYGALSKYGADIPLTVIGIVMKIFSVISGISIGLTIGIQPIASYNYGARNITRVKKLFQRMLLSEFCIGIIALVVFEIFPAQIVSIFGSGDELYMEFATLTMRIYLSGIVFTCVQKGCGAFMQAVGKPIFSATMSLVREVVHVVLIIVLPVRLGVMGILYSAPVCDVVAIIVTGWLTYRLIRHLNMSEEDALEAEAV
ncbi:MAG: MATE family efflux transporter [Eubacteriales bacterium]|nr:MATE family efflux transporter [Eubacteriales bacterium]